MGRKELPYFLRKKKRELESIAREIVCVFNVRAEGALQIYYRNSTSKLEVNLKFIMIHLER